MLRSPRMVLKAGFGRLHRKQTLNVRWRYWIDWIVPIRHPERITQGSGCSLAGQDVSCPFWSAAAVARTGCGCNSVGHRVDRYGPRSGLRNSAERLDRQLWQKHHGAIRVEKGFDAISRLQPQVIPDGLWDRHLAFLRNDGFHRYIPSPDNVARRGQPP